MLIDVLICHADGSQELVAREVSPDFFAQAPDAESKPDTDEA